MNDKSRRVLIVDDEPTNLELMNHILRAEYQPAFATSGAEALEAAKKLNPDIILLDIMMPEMDGYETCRRLKADEKTRDIPVIFVTAKVDTEDETRGLGLGAIDYLTKPVSPPIVKARIRNHVALKIAREKIEQQNRLLEKQNNELIEAARLREDVERITRHDLKSPLNAIINFPRLMMIKDPGLSPSHVMCLEVIEKAGLQMLHMINLSLDLFKMERGIYVLEPRKLDILSIVKRILTENRHFIEQKMLSKIIRVNGKHADDEDSFAVYGEDMLCYSMLANLLKNAIEASPRNEGITIDTSEENDATVIAIHNKGVVPVDIRGKFFDKYATSGKKFGSGLGTYSAKLIAEAHGGKIELDTSDKKGTTVTVRLPNRKGPMIWRKDTEKTTGKS